MAIDNLPRTVNEAYEQILSRSQHKETVRKALSIVLAASRPLTLSEMNTAMAIETTSQALNDLDLENDEDFKTRLRSWCGLFITIHEENIYFLHETAREFLLLNDSGLPEKTSRGGTWQHSITLRDANYVLAECCVRYLDFFNFGGRILGDAEKQILTSFRDHTFSYYAASYWVDHFREAQGQEYPVFIDCAISIMNPDSHSFSKWISRWSHRWRTTSGRFTGTPPTVDRSTAILLPSFLGHYSIVELLLLQGADVETENPFEGRTPPFCAAENGHEATVNLLLEKGAFIEETEEYNGRTALLQAAENGHEAIVDLLLERGANLEATDKDGQTSFLLASKHGHEGLVSLLLRKGANIEELDGDGQTLLIWAAKNNFGAAVDVLLKKGASTKALDSYHHTPLMWAVRNGNETAINMLVGKGADLEAADNDGQTPLIWAVKAGWEAAVRLLLDKGANLEARDHPFGQTPLSWAAESGNEAIAAMLVANGADLWARDKYGCTPLERAIRYRRNSVESLLSEECTRPIIIDD